MKNFSAGFSKILQYIQGKPTSAKVAKERLQIIIAHERGEHSRPDYLSMLQKDLIEVITKYVKINKEDIKIEFERQEGCSILELNVALPHLHDKKEEVAV